MIHPHLFYCLPIYSNTSPRNIDKIFKKQSIKIINKAMFNAHTVLLFHSCGILPVYVLITEQKCILLHPIIHIYSYNDLELLRLSNVQVHSYPLQNIDI